MPQGVGIIRLLPSLQLGLNPRLMAKFRVRFPAAPPNDAVCKWLSERPDLPLCVGSNPTRISYYFNLEVYHANVKRQFSTRTNRMG